MTNTQYCRSVTSCDLFNERYPVLQSLIAYGSQKCSRFTFTDDRALLFEFVDFINTDEGKRIVIAWYKGMSHTIALIQQVASKIDLYDEKLVSTALHVVNVEIDRVITRLISATHSA